MVKAALGFGSNIGEREENLKRGLALLEEEGTVRVLAVSPLYFTKPVDYEDQDWFVNGAAEIETSLSPRELLGLLKSVETSVGRTKGGVRFGPRVLDMDILLYGDGIIEEDDLTIPHPRMDKRRFVLAPLCDIVPDWVSPVSGVSVRGLLDALGENPGDVVPLGNGPS